MVDFRRLRESKAKPQPVDPREIFNALPKPPGINDLYVSQADVLDAWFARRTDKDVVVKFHNAREEIRATNIAAPPWPRARSPAAWAASKATTRTWRSAAKTMY